MNEQLRTQIGQAPGEVTFDWADVQPPTGRSGLVDNGNYELETIAVKTEAKRKSEGLNFVYIDRVVGPAGTGTTIITYHPAPFGEPGSKQVKDGHSFGYSRACAYRSFEGKDIAAIKKDGIKVNWEKSCVGRHFYATLERGDGEYAGNSGIVGYLTKAMYAAAPGPRASSSNGASRQTAAQQPSPLDEAISGMQAAPEVMTLDI